MMSIIVNAITIKFKFMAHFVAVVDLVYWRDLKKSGICFGSTLVLLLLISYFSLLLVLTYTSIAMLTVTVSFFIYKKTLAAVQKSGEGHPFK